MENIKTAISINLSNQANMSRSRGTLLYQFNYFIILGLGYLEGESETDSMPISVNIGKSGDLTINGLDQELINDENISIYSDKKVTNSED